MCLGSVCNDNLRIAHADALTMSSSDSDSDYGDDLGASAAADWTQEEQMQLDNALLLYPPEHCATNVERYILVAAQVPSRSAREVALRIGWLTLNPQHMARGQQSGDLKRRGAIASPIKAVGSAPAGAKALGIMRPSSRQNSRREAAGVQPPDFSDPSPYQPGGLPPPLSAPLLPTLSASCLYQSPSPPTNSNSSDDACIDINAAIAAVQLQQQQPSSSSEGHQPLDAGALRGSGADGMADTSTTSTVQSLMEQNYAILNTFKSNMEQCRVVENTELLVRLRDNVLSCLGHMGSMGGPISSMPPLPVQLNLDLANRFLPPKAMTPAGGPGMGMPPFSFGPSMVGPMAHAPVGMMPIPMNQQIPPPAGMIPMPMAPHMMMMMMQPMPQEMPMPSGMVPSTSPVPFMMAPGMVPQQQQQQQVPQMRPPSPDPISAADQPSSQALVKAEQ